MGENSKKTKINKKYIGSFLIDNLFWLAGTALYSCGVIMFALPNRIAQSGMSGVAIIINYLLHTPIGLTNFVLNIPLMILAWIFLGRNFVWRTLWVTGMLSLILDVFSGILPKYEGDRLLAALFCGALSGVGLSLVLKRGATTGGTDIIARLVRKKFPRVPIGSVIFAVDAVVIILAAVVFRNVESALYAAIVIFTSTRVIDYVLYGMGGGKMLMVFTDCAEEITEKIISTYPRGVSVLPAKGGYTGQERNMLICVVHNNEVSRIMKLIEQTDPGNFTIITRASEILGKGFSE
ncbi:MAG: YitT family protein [Clostridiales bacterium]|nr:YitT family protein [Clostridiales bacterium]